MLYHFTPSFCLLNPLCHWLMGIITLFVFPINVNLEIRVRFENVQQTTQLQLKHCVKGSDCKMMTEWLLDEDDSQTNVPNCQLYRNTECTSFCCSGNGFSALQEHGKLYRAAVSTHTVSKGYLSCPPLLGDICSKTLKNSGACSPLHTKTWAHPHS